MNERTDAAIAAEIERLQSELQARKIVKKTTPKPRAPTVPMDSIADATRWIRAGKDPGFADKTTIAQGVIRDRKERVNIPYAALVSTIGHERLFAQCVAAGYELGDGVMIEADDHALEVPGEWLAHVNIFHRVVEVPMWIVNPKNVLVKEIFAKYKRKFPSSYSFNPDGGDELLERAKRIERRWATAGVVRRMAALVRADAGIIR